MFFWLIEMLVLLSLKMQLFLKTLPDTGTYASTNSHPTADIFTAFNPSQQSPVRPIVVGVPFLETLVG